MYLRKRMLLVIAAALLAAASPFSVAAGPGPVQTPTPAASTATMEMPIVAPLFVVDERFSSTLVLVNGGAVETYADVTVRGLDGSTLATRRVNFAAHSQRQIDIGQLLRAANASATTGSITVMQSPDLTGPAIAGQLSLTYATYPEANYIDEELAMPSANGSQVLRAVSDEADVWPVVAITSLAQAVQHVRINCLSKNGPKLSKTVELGAGETLLTEGCSAETVHGADFQTLRRKAHGDGPKRTVGFELTSDAMPGEFAAFGLAAHKAKGERYFSSVPFTDPKMLMSPNTVFVGVPVGDADLLPRGEYVPELALANFSDKAAHVQIRYARTSGTRPVVQDLPTVLLPPQSSRSVTLDHLRGDSDITNSFVVVSDGNPGDVLAKLVATSDSRLREVETLAKDEEDVNNAGTHPWSLDHETESVLLMFNHSTTSQSFTVLLSTGDQLWQKVYQLKPMQTNALNIGDLIEKRVKDDKGNVLPTKARSGAVGWFVPQRGNGSGRILQSNRSIAMARNFSCGNVVDICGATFTPNTTYLVDGATVPFGSIAPLLCWVSPFTCVGTQFTTGSGYNYSWNSQYTNILAMAAPSGQSSSNVTGVSAGSSYITGTVSNSASPYCSANGGGAGTVRTPDHLVVTSDTTGTLSNCTSTVRRIITYNEVDSSGNSVGTINTREQFGSKGTNSCNTTIRTSETCSSDTNGVLQDALTVGCNSVGGSCGVTFTQQKWQWCPASGSPITIAAPGDLVIHNDAVSVGGNTTGFANGTKIYSDGRIVAP